jgi:hypothetical protein
MEKCSRDEEELVIIVDCHEPSEDLVDEKLEFTDEYLDMLLEYYDNDNMEELKNIQHKLIPGFFDLACQDGNYDKAVLFYSWYKEEGKVLKVPKDINTRGLFKKACELGNAEFAFLLYKNTGLSVIQLCKHYVCKYDLDLAKTLIVVELKNINMWNLGEMLSSIGCLELLQWLHDENLSNPDNYGGFSSIASVNGHKHVVDWFDGLNV